MYRAFVQLETVEDVKRFVACCNEAPFAVELRAGDYVVDAKSIMGIFSLELSKKVALCADCEGAAAAKLAAAIGDFLVDE